MVFPNSNDFLPPPKKKSNPGYSKQIQTHKPHFRKFPWKIAPRLLDKPMSTGDRYVNMSHSQGSKNPGSCDKCFPSNSCFHSCRRAITKGWWPQKQWGKWKLYFGIPYEKYHSSGGHYPIHTTEFFLDDAPILQFKMSQDFSVCQSTQDFPLKKWPGIRTITFSRRFQVRIGPRETRLFNLVGVWAQTPEIWGSKKSSSKWGVGNFGGKILIWHP